MNKRSGCHSTQRYSEELLPNELSCLPSAESMQTCSGQSYAANPAVRSTNDGYLQTTRTAPQPSLCPHPQATVISDHHWGRNAPWHKRPSILANSREHNGALYKTTLSWWGKPVPKRSAFHSQFLRGSWTSIAASQCQTQWQAVTCV